MDETQELLKKIARPPWLEEIYILQKIWLVNDKPSVRDFATILGKSKSWAAVTLLIIQNLNVFPDLDREPTRNAAYRRIKKFRKLARYFPKERK